MTAHELAKELLKGPDLPVVVLVTTPGWYGDVERDYVEIFKVEPSKELYTTSSLQFVGADPVMKICATELG